VVEFTGRTVNRSAAIDAAFNQHVVNTQTGTSYTLLIGDRGNLVTLSNGSAVALTVPTDVTAGFALGTKIGAVNLGAGVVTIGGGVTIVGTLTLAQYECGTLVKVGTNSWVFVKGVGLLKSGPVF